MAGFVQAISATGSNTTTVVLTLTATPAADALIVVASRSSGGASYSTTTDSRGNTYTVQSSAQVSSTTRACIIWTAQDVAPLVSGDTISVSLTTAQTVNAIAYEFSKCLAARDVVGGATGVGVTSLAVPSAALNTTAAYEIAVTVLAHTATGVASAWGITNGFSINDTSLSNRIIASKVTTATGDQQATWSWTGSANTAGVMVTFQQGAAGKSMSLTKPAVQRAASF